MLTNTSGIERVGGGGGGGGEAGIILNSGDSSPSNVG